MEFATIPLLYLCSIAGFLMVVGGMYLIAKEKIYIDRETNQVTEIELPWGGKFKTNVPALALFVLGFVPLIYPIYRATVDNISLVGNVEGYSSDGVDVYAVIGSDRVYPPNQFRLTVPKLERLEDEYKVLFVAAGPIIKDGRPDLNAARNNGEVRIATWEVQRGAQEKLEPRPDSVLPEPDDFLSARAQP